MDECGQIHTLGLVEQLRDELGKFGMASSHSRERIDQLLRRLADPRLEDLPTDLSLHVELWDRHDKHIRWAIAATSNIAIANAAFDIGVSLHPNERLLLRQRGRVLRKHEPTGQ